MLVNGKWSADWQPVQATDAKGGFVPLDHVHMQTVRTHDAPVLLRSSSG